MVSDFTLPADYKAHQEFLKRVALVVDIQVKEVCEKSHKLVDILASAAPQEYHFQLMKQLEDWLKHFGRCLLSSHLQQNGQRGDSVPSRGFEYLHPHLDPVLFGGDSS